MSYDAPRKHLLSDTISGAQALAGGALVQISTTDKKFRKAFFYPLKTVPNTGVLPTSNVGDVLIGEKQDANTFCPDTLSPGASPLVVTAAEGTMLDLKDFWVFIATADDRVFVKYH